MNIKYYLKRGKSDARIIICIISGRGKTLKVATEHSINPDHWDKVQQQAKESSLVMRS